MARHCLVDGEHRCALFEKTEVCLCSSLSPETLYLAAGEWIDEHGMTWLETVTTADFIHGVRNNHYDDLGDILSFSGIVLRAGARF